MILIITVLSGCASLGEQKLADGQSGCQTITTIYGSASSVVTRDDNVAKGSTATGTRRITCGSAVMEINTTIGVTPKPAQ